MRTTILLAGTIAFVLIAGLGVPAFAEVFTYEFSGVVTDVDDSRDVLEGAVVVGSPWSATVEIESDAIDRSQPVGDARGDYRANSITVQIGGLQFANFSPSDDSDVNIVVTRVTPISRTSGFFAGAQDVPQTAGPTLPSEQTLDFTVALRSALDENIFPDDSLPLPATLDLDVFELKGMSLFANSGGGFPIIVLITGTVTSLGDETCPASVTRGQGLVMPDDGCPVGDLIPSDFKPVQAIEDASKLIKNKNTVFKTTIKSTLGQDEMVKIEISEEGTVIISETIRVIANCINTYYFPDVTASHMTGDCSNDSVFNSDTSFKPSTAGSRFFKFNLDSDNKIAETDEGNNELNNIKTVVDMKKKFKIVYKTMSNLEEFLGFPPSEGLAKDNSDDSIKYLKNFLPLPESSVTGKLIAKVYNLKMITDPDKNTKLKAEMRDYLKQLADENKAAVAVGLFRAGGFINSIAGDAAAFAYTPTDDVRNKEVVNIMTTARDGLDLHTAGLKIAHEVFHTYDWVSKAKADDGSGRHFLKHDDIGGYFHQDTRQSFDDANNLMRSAHDFSLSPAPVVVPHLETYDFILDTFQKNEADPPVIYMRGWIAEDGTVVDLPWKKGMGFVDLPLGLSAEYAVQYFDSGDNMIAFTGFGPSLIEGEPDNPTTFFYNIDDIPGTEKITISREGILLVEKNISENSPTVTIQEPNGGEIFTVGESATVKWISSDMDGDDLFYNVLFSTDAGLNWDILALDLPEKEFTFTIPDVPSTTDAIFKVIASDGINTGEDISESFTISSSSVAVGGELIPIEQTSLILANTQTFSWMIPVVLSVVGIGLFVVSRKF